ncbi:MAG: ribbon-helix-helix domain-containing protein [Gemmobacter sp.]|nr:ribbon-helix-helix domain-containing protein [Gemmobacter sp.]
MPDRPAKHSLTLHGHRTSVSLEDEFWEALREVAQAEGRPVAALAAEIDAARPPQMGLASAIRLHLLRHFRNKARTSARGSGGPSAV